MPLLAGEPFQVVSVDEAAVAPCRSVPSYRSGLTAIWPGVPIRCLATPTRCSMFVLPFRSIALCPEWYVLRAVRRTRPGSLFVGHLAGGGRRAADDGRGRPCRRSSRDGMS